MIENGHNWVRRPQPLRFHVLVVPDCLTHQHATMSPSAILPLILPQLDSLPAFLPQGLCTYLGETAWNSRSRALTRLFPPSFFWAQFKVIPSEKPSQDGASHLQQAPSPHCPLPICLCSPTLANPHLQQPFLIYFSTEN